MRGQSVVLSVSRPHPQLTRGAISGPHRHSEALHAPSVHSQTPLKVRTSIKPFLTKTLLSDWVKASASLSSRFSLVDWQWGVDQWS